MKIEKVFINGQVLSMATWQGQKAYGSTNIQAISNMLGLINLINN